MRIASPPRDSVPTGAVDKITLVFGANQSNANVVELWRVDDGSALRQDEDRGGESI